MNESDLDRRHFGAALAALGLIALPAVAADEPKDPVLADALYDQLLARFGKHLDADERKVLRARLKGRPFDLRSAMKLDWRDEPAFTYSPDEG